VYGVLSGPIYTYIYNTSYLLQAVGRSSPIYPFIHRYNLSLLAICLLVSLPVCQPVSLSGYSSSLHSSLVPLRASQPQLANMTGTSTGSGAARRGHSLPAEVSPIAPMAL
jgi:hypothetical protein